MIEIIRYFINKNDSNLNKFIYDSYDKKLTFFGRDLEKFLVCKKHNDLTYGELLAFENKYPRLSNLIKKSKNYKNPAKGILNILKIYQ